MKPLLTILAIWALTSCSETPQSVIKTDDNLTANIKLILEKYEKNDLDVSGYYADSVICKLNNTTFTGYHNLKSGLQAQHDVLYDNIKIDDLYIHTNYFVDGEKWTRAWFNWIATGKTTGNDYVNRVHFDYKWENGKIVEFLAYFPEKGEAEEIAAYSKASKN